MHKLAIEIGDMPIVVRTDSAEFVRMLADRYGEFVVGKRKSKGVRRKSLVPSLDVQIVPLGQASDAEDLSVRRENGLWVMERGDFRAEYDPESGRGRVRQSLFPHAIDGVLRILHSLILAREGGFLVHAASAVRQGRAYLFAGVSGAGKTTIARLAPPDVTLLTDEISYVRSQESGVRSQELEVGSEELEARSEGTIQNPKSAIGNRRSAIDNRPSPAPRTQHPEPRTPHPAPAFLAYGTPFAGEMASLGQKLRAPLAALFLLQQGPENHLEPVSNAQATRELMRHVLFFAQDQELVGSIFETVCKFVHTVPVHRLVFKKDASVWELIKD